MKTSTYNPSPLEVDFANSLFILQKEIEKHLQDNQKMIFEAGANSILIGNYLTTNGYDVSADMRLLEDAGLVPAIQF